uniref:Uncharacterized protein n=1 Tax=Glossina morsitans morsitans TaxID=37546 RepID=A0A1B0G091_GLOMM
MLEHHWNILMKVLICWLRDKNKITLQLNLPNHPEVLILNCLSEIFDSAQKSLLRNLLELSCDRSSQTTPFLEMTPIAYPLSTLDECHALQNQINMLINANLQWGSIVLIVLKQGIIANV